MLARALDLIFPPQCLKCHGRVPLHGTLCVGCWKEVPFIADPYCACCGLPFEFSLGEGALCAGCVSERPEFSRARAAFSYDDASRTLITALKYNDQLHLASTYGTWIAKAGQELLAASDLIVPVPLHWRRFLGRRYNQSALLAQALSKKTGIPAVPDALKRIRHTATQTGLSRQQRLKNLQGAFVIHNRYADTIRGKSVLLVDDVFTTGATINQCSRVLLHGGATHVNVLTLARKI